MALAGIMMLTNCTQENVIPEAQVDTSLKEGEIYIDVPLPNFKNDSKKDSRVSYDDTDLSFKWESTDKLLICSDAVPTGETFTYVKEVGNKARFKGKVPATTTEAPNLYCYYQAAKLNVTTNNYNNGGAINYPASGESMGTVKSSAPTAHLRDYLLLSGQATAEELKNNGVTLSLQNAIMRFDLKSLHSQVKFDYCKQVSWSVSTGKKLTLDIGDAKVLDANFKLFFAFDPKAMVIPEGGDLSLKYNSDVYAAVTVSATSVFKMDYQAGYRYYIGVGAKDGADIEMCEWKIDYKNLKVGDFLMADGAFVRSTDSEILKAGTPIGIVYNTIPERIGEKAKELGFTHGSVMALKNAGSSKQWSKNQTDNDKLTNITSLEQCYNDIDGYSNTQLIRGLHEKVEDLQTPYSAFHAALTFNPSNVESSLQSTGWYLPAIGEWYDILKNLGNVDMQQAFQDKLKNSTGSIPSVSIGAAGNINTKMKAEENATNVDKFDVTDSQTRWFWSSSEYNAEYARTMSFISNGLLNVGYPTKSDTNSLSRVRCVLAF